MKKMKAIGYKIMFELMKNSKRSDRQIAKILGVSQPTVTRRRGFLEKELIDGYTAIPKWEKLGFEILAFTFVKIKVEIATREKYSGVRKKGGEWLMEQPNVVMSGACRGMGMDSFSISFHKSYSDYDEWMRNMRLEMGDFIQDVQCVLVNLRGKEILKPLHFKYLVEAE